VLFAALILFLAGYAVYLFFLEHYVVSILPPVICLIFMAWEALQRTWPGQRISTFCLIALTSISVASLWPVVPIPALPVPFAPDQKAASRSLAALPVTPAVVLFRFNPDPDPKLGSSFHDDPVYNDEVAWPDDGKIVRARDLGPENDRAIVEYYSEHQPDRMFYIYDANARAAGENPLSAPLGTARELEIRGTGLSNGMPPPPG
jgi:hypothetical protein